MITQCDACGAGQCATCARIDRPRTACTRCGADMRRRATAKEPDICTDCARKGRNFSYGHCDGCGNKGRFDTAAPPPWLCLPCSKNRLTPIQIDCIARQARCFGCHHMDLVESLQPGQCHVKRTLAVRTAIAERQS